jgi:glutamate synthase (NADPH) small chain
MRQKTPRQDMPVQDPKERGRNFDEVALGFTEEQALCESERCLTCKRPLCIKGCPVDVPIPEFIRLVREKKYLEAASCIKSKNSLPAVCGRVCPQELQCESKCVIGKKEEPVAIGRLERFVADYDAAHKKETKTTTVPPLGRKAAIIGSGPAGLTCAGDLAKLGYEVTIFEALHKPGGVLIYGIPEFRLPKRIIGIEVDFVRSLGVNIEANVVAGRAVTIDELFEEGYEAVFVGSGAGAPIFMNIPGENLKGVYSANEFLTRVNLMKSYRFPEYDTPINVGRKVAVVGGGNVAMDAARSALRLGAEEVHIVYRRSMQEMPARVEEVHHAQEEGIVFDLLCNPTKVLGDERGWVKGMECIRMELSEPDESGRRRPVPKKGSEFVLDVDIVIMSLGTRSNPIIAQTTPGLAVNKWGYIVADEETMATSKAGVYAGGDIVTGAATVIQAMGAGKKAAKAMDSYIRAKCREGMKV